MVALTSLWLPILLSAVAVFVASSVVHMMLPFHKNDFDRVADEDGVMDALRKFGLQPGDYMMPAPKNMKDMGTEEFMAKRMKGPVMTFTVMPGGPFSMVPNLTQWFVFCIVVNLFAAYIASNTLNAGTEYLQVFRITGAASFMGYALGTWPNSIWYKRKWSTSVKATVDALIYALLVGGVFGWLWPK